MEERLRKKTEAPLSNMENLNLLIEEQKKKDGKQFLGDADEIDKLDAEQAMQQFDQ